MYVLAVLLHFVFSLGSCACSACGKACGGGSARVPYLVLIVLSVILSLVLYLHAGDFLVNWFHINVPPECADSPICLGQQLVFRVSFALFIFFAIMALSQLTGIWRSLPHICSVDICFLK